MFGGMKGHDGDIILQVGELLRRVHAIGQFIEAVRQRAVPHTVKPLRTMHIMVPDGLVLPEE